MEFVIPMRYRNIKKSSFVQNRAMTSVKSAVGKYFPPDNCIVYSDSFKRWETTLCLLEESIKNISLVFVCVLVISFLLILNILASVLVGICLIFTMVDIIGTLYFWNIPIDLVSSIALVIMMGLTVDYSIHIMHTFMTIKGKRNDRMSRTLNTIGLAVFYGGLSTFLAICPQTSNKLVLIQEFSIILLLVVLFGMFHGLVFLPVLLSVVGPTPYVGARHIDSDDNTTEVSQVENNITDYTISEIYRKIN